MTAQLLNISAEQYHADSDAPEPSLSRSLAMTLLKQSPLHAWLQHPRLNPAYQPDESSKFDLGTAVHSILLEGLDIVEVIDAEDWRTKAAKEARDAAREAGKVPLLTSQYTEVLVMVKAANEFLERSDQLGGHTFATGDNEKTIIWQENGIWCRVKPDSMSTKLVLDYKSTELSQGAWIRAIAGNGYDLQDAMYSRAVEELTGVTPRFIFMAQEAIAPYLCYLVELSESYKEIGRQKFNKALKIWGDCIKSNKWPGYDSRITMAEPPAWAVYEAEDMAAEIDGFSVEAFMFGKVPEKTFNRR